MWNEHFGIGIVEMMAAGLIVVAHDSGGPKSDIIVPVCSSSTNNTEGVGFLATTKEDYAQAMYKALTLEASQSEAIRKRAQESAQRFSDKIFDTTFKKTFLDAKVLS